MGNSFRISKSNIHGNGCFSVDPIMKGKSITIMNGEEINIIELIDRFKLGRENIMDPLQIEDLKYIDLYDPYVYFNHSCDPNAAIIALG